MRFEFNEISIKFINLLFKNLSLCVIIVKTILIIIDFFLIMLNLLRAY